MIRCFLLLSALNAQFDYDRVAKWSISEVTKLKLRLLSPDELANTGLMDVNVQFLSNARQFRYESKVDGLEWSGFTTDEYVTDAVVMYEVANGTGVYDVALNHRKLATGGYKWTINTDPTESKSANCNCKQWAEEKVFLKRNQSLAIHLRNTVKWRGNLNMRLFVRHLNLSNFTAQITKPTESTTCGKLNLASSSSGILIIGFLGFVAVLHLI